MQQYQFDRIFDQMRREFGKIRKGTEDDYTMVFFPLEGNALKVHRKNPASNSRRLREAIALALFDIKARCTGEEINLDEFRNEDNEKLEHALLMAVDPFTNEELRETIEVNLEADWEDKEFLRKFYTIPVICLLRIKDSVDLWQKHGGANGYFDFMEGQIGAELNDDEMRYSAVLPQL